MKKIKKGKVITVTSMKGGVGKSNVLLTLAGMFYNLGKKILIIDLDLYSGDVGFILNLKQTSSIFNLCDDINNNRYKADKISNYLGKYNDNIYALTAPKDPRQASKINPSYVELIINGLSNKFDVILIDTTHVLNPYNMMAFSASDKILEVFTNDALDMKSTKSFISICKNMGVDNVITVLNNSMDLRKNYFSKYDMKSVVGKNIDYIVPESLFVKKIDSYLMDGVLMDYYLKRKNRDYGKFLSITSIISDEEEGDSFEK